MAALLEMNTSPAESEPAPQVKSPMRFTYASGSRPLEGYTIKRGVGRGGFGEVYFAVSDAGKEVALKLIRRNLEVELRGVTHCLNLKHPNLVALYDIRTDEHEDRWVVMEFIAGESLEDLIDRYPEGMPRELAMKWFEGICSAVNYLHDHGIVHRDLKPANIFIDDDTIKIGDYGLSKFISCSRRSGQTESVGTVHYMAPEIANGRYGREIDAYALGIILYEMLTGRVPFEGESVGEVLMKHLTAEPNLDAVDEPFRSVVRGAMAKDPERRINSAADMIAMLGGARPSQAASAGAPGAFAARPEAPVAPTLAATAAPSAGRPKRGSALAFFHRDPDPVWAGVTAAWEGMRKDLNYASWPVTGRIAFAVFCVVVFATMAPFWLVIGITLACAYFAYLTTRCIVRATTHAPVEAMPTMAFYPAARAAAIEPNDVAAEHRSASSASTSAAVRSTSGTRAPWRHRGQASWKQAAHQQLLSQSWRERASSVLGSMVAAGVVAPVASLLVCMMLAPELQLELTLWTATVTTAAAWALIVPGQLAEARMEDHAPLRFIHLLLGALVGLLAWALAESLYLQMPASRNFSPGPMETIASELFGQRFESLQSAYRSGMIAVPAALYAGFFGFLFAALRWWRLAESTRAARVSLWSTAWCAFIGWALTFFLWFPQPMGLLLAAVIAFAVQLSSPWLSPSRRRELAQKAA
jgi:hypothetical protein